MLSHYQVEQALKDPDKFHQVFDKTLKFTGALNRFPDLADALVQYLMEHQEEFDRLITKRASFLYLVENVPALADKLVKFICIHPNEFERLIVSDDDLKACAKSASPAFSHHATIFKQPSLKEALNTLAKMVIAKKEIHLAARYLALGHKDETNLLSSLPLEILVQIIGNLRYDAGNEIISKKTAEDIANRFATIDLSAKK